VDTVITPLLDRVVDFLKTNDRSATAHLDASYVEFDVGCKNAEYRIFVDVDEVEGYVSCLARSFVYIDEGRKKAMAELIARINWRQAIGCFDINYNTNQLFYRAAVDVLDSHESLTDPVIDNLIAVCLSTMDRSYPFIMRLNFCPDTTPEQICEEIATEAEKLSQASLPGQ